MCPLRGWFGIAGTEQIPYSVVNEILQQEMDSFEKVDKWKQNDREC
jgi:hypothetical protein